MKYSTNRKNGNKKQAFLLFLIMVTTLALTSLVIASAGNKSDYLNTRDDVIELLEKEKNNYDPHRLLLENIDKDSGNAFAEKLNASIRWARDGSFAALVLPENTTILDVCSDDDNKDYLSCITPDYYAEMCEAQPNLIASPPSATFNDSFFNEQTYLNYINLTDVWNYTKGSGVTVAVVDTGIDTDHEEFIGRLNEYSYNASEDKVVKDQPLVDGEYDWSILEDEYGHGTSVAGTICAAANGVGIVGIAPEIDLIVVKCVTDEKGHFAGSDLKLGIAYAISLNVDIINMSFCGGPYSSNPYTALTQSAVEKNIICVAGAGNNSSNNTFYPASDPNVIGAGALAKDNWSLASYSNYGINSDVVAPGTVYVSSMGGGYSIHNGTSFASPVTAAVIALYLSYHGKTSFAEIKELLQNSSYDLGEAGNDALFGFGAINATAFILEEKGTATFYPGNGDSAVTKKFVREHTLQDIPLPVWSNKYFVGWYYDENCENALTSYYDVFSDDLSLYAKWSDENIFSYNVLADGSIEITSSEYVTSSLVIPDQIDGKTVTKIAENAFRNTYITTNVTFPSTLKEIGDNAFYNCTDLTNITLPEGLLKIGIQAFSGCTSVRTVSVPDTIEDVGENAFDTISTSTANSSNGCYYYGNASKPYTILYRTNNKSATSRQINSGTKIICNDAFAESSLTSVVIPNSVKVLGERAFSKCKDLKSVTLGSGVTVAKTSAFGNCSSLADVTVIDLDAFYDIDFATAAANPLCFRAALHYNNEVVTELVVPDDVTAFKQYAFFGWQGTTVTVFGEIESIGTKAFQRCPSLQTIVYHDDIERWNAIPKDNSWCDDVSAINIVVHQYSCETTTAATCTEAGRGNFTCSVCDHTIEKDIEPLGHDMVLHDAKAPTCSEKGWAEYGVCSRCEFSTYEEIAALGHDLTHHDAKAPTCTEAGWNEYDTCSRCDYTTYAPIEAMGHDIIRHESKVPTCTEVGHNAYEVCTRCDYTTYEETSALGHDYSLVVTTPRTCTEQGYTTHTCSRCGDSYIDGRLAAMGHFYNSANAVVIAPTCTEAGYTNHPCSRCDYSYHDAYTEALGHDYIDHGAQAPTCTEAGWEAYESCSRCYYSTIVEIEPLGHDLTHHDAKAATCTAIGWDEYDACSRCDYTTYQKIPELGHDLTRHAAKAATCTEVGWNEYNSCSRCDHTTYKEIPALGHDLSYYDGKTATCTEKGWEAYETCSRCDHSTYEEIPALGHDIVSYDAKAATCTEVGHNAYEACTRCDLTGRVEIPALGHDITYYDAKAATCTEIGWDAYETCSRCDHTTYEEIAALGHDLTYYDGKAATCTEKGWNAYETCSRCDHSTYSEIAALGHDIAYYDPKTATCTEKGWNAYETCSRCDHTTYQETPALGHDLTYYDGKATTCTEKGWDAYETCSRCDHTTYQETPALGHDLIYYERKAATCTEKGWNAYEACSRCDRSTYSELPALGHDYDSVTVPPTCEQQGFVKHTCSRCSRTYADEYVDATGHLFGEWTVLQYPTASVEGRRQHVCQTCGTTETAEILFSEEGQKFVDNFNNINLADGKIKSSDYYAICQAATTYYSLSDDEKQWLAEDYKTLVSYARRYNEIAENVNNDIDAAAKNSFSLFSLLSQVLSAVWIALKDLF